MPIFSANPCQFVGKKRMPLGVPKYISMGIVGDNFA